MCALTEKVIFTDPYMLASYNRWTTPQLDSYAEGIRKDSDLKLCATRLKEIFLTNPQALLHGDLHSGSVMVDEGSTFVIDPEFAFYGPIGFDLGAFVSNLFLNYFSQSARLSSGGADYAEWVLSQIITFYETFQDRFSSLWEESWREGMISELYPKSICSSDSQFQQARDRYMSAIYADMLGFTGMKMIRRIVGIAHVADLDSISDSEIRSVCEKRCLNFARKMVFASLFETKRHEFLSIRKVVQYARILFTEKPSPQYQY
jgi:5-methylthioribose kinase